LFFRAVPSANTLVQWVNENAFASIVQARPCPTFGRPVHLRGSPHRLRPGTSPHALRIPPHDGHPALRETIPPRPARHYPRFWIRCSSFEHRRDFNPPEQRAAQRTLRPLAIAHQKKIYGLLMRAAAAALQKLARDPRYVGARLGCLAVLHTWTRAMQYHPHVHMLATAGGLSADGAAWREPKHAAFLVPVEALSVIFRAKLCTALKKAGLLREVPPAIWKKKWVVHCQPAGRGQKVLEYLGRYVFRVAITNSRLERIDDGQVTFRYRDNRSQELRHVTVTGGEFIRRFLLHVLPRGCTKVRYYGIWSGSCRHLLDKAQTLLAASFPDAAVEKVADLQFASSPSVPRMPNRCPYCKAGNLIPIHVIHRQRGRPP